MEEYQRTLVAAQGYCELQMYAEALEELDSLPPEAQAHAVVVEMHLVTLMQAKRWEAAVEYGMKLCELRPDSSSGFIHLAFCLHELGLTDKAKAWLMKVWRPWWIVSVALRLFPSTLHDVRKRLRSV